MLLADRRANQIHAAVHLEQTSGISPVPQFPDAGSGFFFSIAVREEIVFDKWGYLLDEFDLPTRFSKLDNFLKICL